MTTGTWLGQAACGARAVTGSDDTIPCSTLSANISLAMRLIVPLLVESGWHASRSTWPSRSVAEQCDDDALGLLACPRGSSPSGPRTPDGWSRPCPDVLASASVSACSPTADAPHCHHHCEQRHEHGQCQRLVSRPPAHAPADDHPGPFIHDASKDGDLGETFPERSSFGRRGVSLRERFTAASNPACTS